MACMSSSESYWQGLKKEFLPLHYSTTVYEMPMRNERMKAAQATFKASLKFNLLHASKNHMDSSYRFAWAEYESVKAHKECLEMKSHAIKALEFPKQLLEADFEIFLPGELIRHLMSEIHTQMLDYAEDVAVMKTMLSKFTELTSFHDESIHSEEQSQLRRKNLDICQQLDAQNVALLADSVYIENSKKISYDTPNHAVPVEFKKAFLHLIHSKESMAEIACQVSEQMDGYYKFASAVLCSSV